MKIGILTVYYANYGSYYQAMCLYNILTEMGYDCEFINTTIRGKYIVKYYLAKKLMRILPKKISMKLSSINNEFAIAYSLYKDLKKMNISPDFISRKKLSSRYDCIVVGSDELWSATNNSIKYIPAYFGIGFNTNLISYAVSAITLHDVDERLRTKMTNGIKKFSNISVRDVFTKNWIKENVGVEATITLDPVLLNPYFTKNQNKTNEDYILVYGQHFDNKSVDCIKKYSENCNKKIFSVSWKQSWCNDFYLADARELQQLYLNADMIFCSTFHGVLFSIVNEKQFRVYLAPKREKKILEVLEQLNIENVIIESNEIDYNYIIDYKKVNERLEILRRSSLKYLSNSISKIH